MNGIILLKGVIIGLAATATMDAGGMLGARLGIAGRGPRLNGYNMIGRWISHLFRGRFRHRTIADAEPLPHEVALGVISHYMIGIILAVFYLGLFAAIHAVPTVISSLVYGMLTNVFPWFLMFPSEGLGVFGRKAPGAHLLRTSFYNHFMFGVGLAVWTVVIHPL